MKLNVNRQHGVQIARLIGESGRSVYDSLSDRPDLIFASDVLEAHLSSELCGLNLAYPLRTRSHVAKSAVATALGYVPPKSFARVRPRFPGQDLDVYVQKAVNLQVWNEEIAPLRRYVVLRLGGNDRVTGVKVVSGEALALLDRTGTLTQKFQAARVRGNIGSKLVSSVDTGRMVGALGPRADIAPEVLAAQTASDVPMSGSVLSIAEIFRRLRTILGEELPDPGRDQERLRGVALQRVVCRALGIGTYGDGGQFPDVLSQALEVKLQLSPTIDLGLVSPDSTDPVTDAGGNIVHSDVRYAIVYAERISDSTIRTTDIVVSTGAEFFTEFRKFEGRVANRKLQIPLPRDFFGDDCDP